MIDMIRGYFPCREEYGGKANGLIKIRNVSQFIPDTYIVTPNETLMRIHDRFFHYDDTRWAVRSSATNEDGGDLSYAGQYLSLLNVKGEDVAEAVRQVRESAKGDTSYRAKLEAEREGDTQMTVLVQKMIEPLYAGVLFKGDPYTHDLNANILEYVSGLADKLVAGEVAPRGTVRWTNDNIGPLLDLPFNLGSLSVALTTANRVTPRGEGGDFEWVYATNHVFFFVQYRPLTKVDWVRREAGQNVVSIGDFDPVEGTVAKMPGKTAKEGEILVAKMTTPSMIDAMIRASAIVTEIGGITCHAAIVARELNKPCIVGYEKARYLHSGQKVRVDTRKREVEIL